ncbi:diguanylate cyclase [Aquitalea sp. S1-19]|nr:diguanylate cyclase [Aquitalea sp. S1-19]
MSLSTLPVVIRSICILLLTGLSLATQATALKDPSIEFTPMEMAYIEQAGAIRMCVDPDWAPFEHIDQEGKHVGIAADLVQLVAQRVGLKIELYRVKTWEESLAASKAGRCQLMSFLNQTPARDKWLNFTDPIFFDPNIVVTREEHSYIGDLNGLVNQTVALPRGTMVEERIRRDYPNLKLILTETEQQSVAKVSAREADMTIRSLIVAAYAIKKEGLFNLKIAGQVPDFTNKLRIGVIKDEKILRDILDKGVKTLTSQEREAISNKHVSVNVQRGIDYTLVWLVIVGGGLIMLLVLTWNRKLNSLNKQLELLSITDRLTGLFNRMKLDATLASESMRAQRSGQPFSLIMIDVDYFKNTNDVHGHQTGDSVLVEIAQLLQSSTRKTDVVGRWGGEEFLIICPHTDSAGAYQLAENLRKKIQDFKFSVVGHKTASFGVASFQIENQGQDIVSRADAALYAAKERGRNRVETK